ncbi:hypothetical protein D3093_35695 (plasmid) [Azospirillum argentinense]|uniref:Uncharacterized protein n=1 Tax=Azospirillum argentinense TaxID=2970906 RepID=A0A4D8PR57_9PROT|nr:hypothetical protein D3093_34840 [Azospirillum argentinense]QCO00588.1 hypothetical protein D3093_35695 [Azospirillum argentinense]
MAGPLTSLNVFQVSAFKSILHLFQFHRIECADLIFSVLVLHHLDCNQQRFAKCADVADQLELTFILEIIASVQRISDYRSNVRQAPGMILGMVLQNMGIHARR